MSSTPDKKSVIAYAMLLLITAVWGVTFVLMQVAVLALSPALAVCVRFGLSTLCLLPLALRSMRDPAHVRAGVILGLFNGAIFGLLTTASLYLPAPRIAFLMSTSVAVVPLLAAAQGRHAPAFLDMLAAAIGIAGTVVLTGGGLAGPSPADGLALLASLITACGLLVLQRFTSRPGVHPETLVFYQSAVTAALAAPVALWQRHEINSSPRAWSALLYCALLGTVLAYVLQARFQRHTRPAAAAMIYTLKPVFSLLYACVFVGTSLGREMLWGGGLILIGSLLPALR